MGILNPDRWINSRTASEIISCCLFLLFPFFLFHAQKSSSIILTSLEILTGGNSQLSVLFIASFCALVCFSNRIFSRINSLCLARKVLNAALHRTFGHLLRLPFHTISALPHFGQVNRLGESWLFIEPPINPLTTFARNLNIISPFSIRKVVIYISTLSFASSNRRKDTSPPNGLSNPSGRPSPLSIKAGRQSSLYGQALPIWPGLQLFLLLLGLWVLGLLFGKAANIAPVAFPLFSMGDVNS